MESSLRHAPPVGGFHDGRKRETPAGRHRLQQRGQALPPFGEGQPAQILAAELEQIVGDEDHRHLGKDLPAEALETDPSLHLGE